MRRPVLVIVIGYIIGIIWGLYIKISIVSLYVFLIILYIIINKKYKREKFKILSIKRYFRYIKIFYKINIIIVIIISSFISNLIIKKENYKYENLYKGVEQIEVNGKIISNKKEKEYKNRYKLKVTDKKYKNTYLYINVNKNIKLEYGDYVKIKGDFKEPQIATNYKGFNYKEYLKTIKVYGTVDIKSIENYHKTEKIDIMRLANDIFLKIKQNIENTYSEKTQSIVLGILLGYTDDIEQEIKDKFSESNISHILAVSGMHISYIIFLLSNSVQFLFGKRRSKIISSIVLIIYMLITGLSVSVVRACIMGIIACMAFIFYRKSDTINNIAISMLIILINNPFNILGLSFLLSYGGTIGIILFQSIIEKMLKNIKVRNRKWKYLFIKLQKKLNIVIKTIAVTISAQIIIIPIIVLKFNNIGIAFLITNLLLSIVIGLVVMGGFIQIIISFISVKCATEIAKVIEIPVYSLVWISEIGGKIPFGNFKVITPNIYQVILYYLIVFISIYLYQIFNKRYLTQTQKRIKNMIFLLKYKLKPYKKFLIILICIIIMIILLIIKYPGNLKIFFVDVGQGDATVIVTPNNKTILIDGGGSSSYDVGKNTLLPYLLDRKISKIDILIISHFDQDHVGSILTILEQLKVKKIIIGKQFESSENLQKFLNIVRKKKINVDVVEAGDKINVEKDVFIDVIWPSSQNVINQNSINNNSLVCKLNYNDFSCLFTGDIEEVAEKEILKNSNKIILNSDILKVPHHGSNTSTTKSFLNAVNPSLALIGVGANNKFGHPNDEILKRLLDAGVKIFRTDENGEICIYINRKGSFSVKTNNCINLTNFENNKTKDKF